MARKQKPVDYPETVGQLTEVAELFTNNTFVNNVVRANFPDQRMQHMREDLKTWMKELGTDLSAIALKTAQAAEVYQPEEEEPETPETDAEVEAAANGGEGGEGEGEGGGEGETPETPEAPAEAEQPRGRGRRRGAVEVPA